MDRRAKLFEELCIIVEKLRDPLNGCPWDRQQTHHSLKPYAVEEVYELLEAIDEKPGEIAQELGDVLLQVLLHAQIGSDCGNFTIEEVLTTLKEKLIERHPHVFGEVKVANASEVEVNWEKIKAKGREPSGLIEGIPKALPALAKAAKIGKRVAKIGFDWPTIEEIQEKVHEEFEEMQEALKNSGPSSREVAEEMGDLLFTLAQLSRKLGQDPEEILQAACRKFKHRFNRMEEEAKAPLSSLEREELEELWRVIKRER